METKFTKGEWNYYNEFNGGIEVAQDFAKNPIPSRICVISCNDEEAEANAKLIAAAPEMISMLIALNETIESGVAIIEGDTIHKNMLKLIKKATS